MEKIYQLAKALAPLALLIKREVQRLEYQEQNNFYTSLQSSYKQKQAIEQAAALLQDLVKEFPESPLLKVLFPTQSTNMPSQVLHKTVKQENSCLK